MEGRRSERGVALIICMLALVLLSVIGLGMMYMADTETAINRNYRDSQQAYFSAVAGLQEVRERLAPTSAFPLAPPTALPTNPPAATNAVYVLNWDNRVAKANIQPWNTGNAYFDTEFCHENFGPTVGPPVVTNTGPDTPCADVPSGVYYTTADSRMPTLVGTSANLPYRWVRVTLKANRTSVADTSNIAGGFFVNGSTADNTVPICWDGVHQLLMPAGYGACDDNPPPPGRPYLKSVYVLTSLAITQTGSRRMAQMEVANDPPFVTNAALDTDNFVTVHGASTTVNGYDNCKCSCTTGVGSHDPVCTDRITHTACTGSTYAIYSSQEVNVSGSPALVAPTSPAYMQNQAFPYDVPALIRKYSNKPGAVDMRGSPYNLTCTTPTPPAYPNCGNLSSGILGTVPNPFPPTDPNNPVGAVNQVTYVPGSLDLRAHSSGAGILVVDGDLTINGGLDFYGLIIVRGVVTFSGSGSGQAVNVYGAIIAGQGSIADSLSGGVNVQFDRCALLNNNTPAPPIVITTHELSY